MGFDNHMIAGDRACPTFNPADSLDLYQPGKPALCRGPGPAGIEHGNALAGQLQLPRRVAVFDDRVNSPLRVPLACLVTSDPRSRCHLLIGKVQQGAEPVLEPGVVGVEDLDGGRGAEGGADGHVGQAALHCRGFAHVLELLP
jgi:hypothetical protein